MTTDSSPLDQLDRALAEADGLAGQPRRSGRLLEVVGTVLRARVPGIHLGELVEVRRGNRTLVRAEAVGFHGDDAVLMPLGSLEDTGPDCRVIPSDAPCHSPAAKRSSAGCSTGWAVPWTAVLRSLRRTRGRWIGPRRIPYAADGSARPCPWAFAPWTGCAP